MTIKQCAYRAIEIHAEEDEAAGYDSGFDGGEFSGPWHVTNAERRIKEMAQENGLTLADIEHEMNCIVHES